MAPTATKSFPGTTGRPERRPIPASNLWQTPEAILDRVRQVGLIALDPCTVEANPCGAEKIITPECDPDGLSAKWSVITDDGLVYANIPYGRGLASEWAAKIITEAAHGAEIIALTRGDLSTRWGRAMVDAARLICFPPRIKFRGATGSPNFSNALFYFGHKPKTFRRAFEDLGPIVASVNHQKPKFKKSRKL